MIVYLIEFNTLMVVDSKLKIGQYYDLISGGINFGQAFVIGSI